VVKRGSALEGVQDTTSVSLEDRSVGLDGDGGWSLGDGSLEGRNGSGWNVSVGLDLVVGGLLVSASSISGSVWVLRLVLDTVGFEIVEGM